MGTSGGQEAAAAADARHWVPDNRDGSGWAPVDWASVVRGSRYHYRHGAAWTDANAARPAFYKVVTRLESPELAPHENSYFVERERLADLLAELALAGGVEVIWHVEPCPVPPPACRGSGDEGGTAASPACAGDAS